ncbi:hypothetical protein [Kitasatospora sp. NPDC059327]|uniref:hypothetical protein n=1 Tax=Kitasatospora sp. NPDC059327 TaxID=3346803 RepID=UPI0036D09759
MEPTGDGGPGHPAPTEVRNDLSGQVSGPAIQAGSIHGDVNVVMVTTAREPDLPDEADLPDQAVAERLRRSSRSWRARFSSVDLVNLPRIAMLADGKAVISAAAKAGLDVTKPFGGQALAPGLFVQNVRPLFETWHSEEATKLADNTVDDVYRGLLVSFEGRMRCRNPPRMPPTEPTGVLSKDPHLLFDIGERRVIITFDPRWLTTSTASGTLHTAARNPLVYSGLGVVTAVLEDGTVRVSALVFGQPESPFQSQLKHAETSRLRTPAGLTTADFQNEHSTRTGQPLPRLREGTTVRRTGVALLFDEDQVISGQIDRSVLARSTRIAPEYRRDLGVAVASLVLGPALDVGATAADIAAHLLARAPSLWKSVTVPGLTALLCARNIAVSTVTGLSTEQIADLDELMRAEVPSYLGGVELDRTLPIQEQLFPEYDQYHVVGAELRLVHSAESRYIAEAEGLDLDEPLEEWRRTGLFRTVTWEEDTRQSAEEEQVALYLLQDWLGDRAD